jgi:hypothetical protein
MSLGLDVFEHLCATANQLERLRQDYPEGSPAWVALTTLVQELDRLIDELVRSEGLDEEDE